MDFGVSCCMNVCTVCMYAYAYVLFPQLVCGRYALGQISHLHGISYFPAPLVYPQLIF